MRDLIFLAYIAAWVGLACFVNRVPFWHPRVLQHGDITITPDQRPAGCMMLLFLGMGAMIGATLPMAISEWLPRNPYLQQPEIICAPARDHQRFRLTINETENAPCPDYARLSLCQVETGARLSASAHNA